MKKRSDRCHFTFSPSKSESKKKGSATHYPPNQGLIKLDDALAHHIFNCVLTGKPPTLFSQGWWDPVSRNFNVGLAIPREHESETIVSEDFDAASVFEELMQENER
jgi:hypothetical protein